MIRFERSFDYPLIRDIITHPKLWPHLSDDLAGPASQFQPVQHPSIWYVLPWDHATGDEPPELLGLWMFVPQTSICWDVHTALLPCAWGPRGQLAARLLPGWIWTNTPCRRIVTSVPSNNRLALHFAIKSQMVVYGVNRESYLKDGILRDQTCLGISRPAVWPPAEVQQDLDNVLEEDEEELCRQPR